MHLPLLLVLAAILVACEAEPPSRSPSTVEAEQADALRALGYVDVAEDVAADEPTGVRVHDAARAFPGLNYLTSATLCSSQLIDMAGRVMRSWSLEPCQSWENSILLPSGEVLAIHHDAYSERTPEASAAAASLIKLSWEGDLIWKARIVAHHDVGTMPDGRIVTLTRRSRVIPALHASVPVREDIMTVLSPEGHVEEEASLTDILLKAKGLRLREVSPRKRWLGQVEINLTHANSIEWMRRPLLAEKHPIFSLDHVIVTMRNQNLVAVIDWPEKELVWSWGSEILQGPHAATVTSTGTILVFDNGLQRLSSRVLEVDPLTKHVVWHYAGSNGRTFFSVSRGASQRLPNGNTLITVSDSARTHEVTPEGEIVWSYLNTERGRESKPAAIVRTRRFVPREDVPEGVWAPREVID